MPHDMPLASMGTAVRKSGARKDLAALEGVAPCEVRQCSDMTTIVVQHGSTGNDPAMAENDARQRVSRARSTGGFGDAAFTDVTAFVPTAGYPLRQSARDHRAFVLRRIIVAAIRAAAAIARSAYVRHLTRRRARDIYTALHGLDDRTLRDLGFDRSEIGSVAAEAVGEAASARVLAIVVAGSPSRRLVTGHGEAAIAPCNPKPRI